MTAAQMREKIKYVYPNATWASRVSKMADNQVIAVYYSFLKSGRFEKPKKLRKNQEGYQWQITDYI